MEPPPKLCPQCGEEYLHTVATCGDCGVPLVDESELARRQEETAPSELPASEELASLRSADPSWIRALSEALSVERIPHRVELVEAKSRARGGRCVLLVRREDTERALGIDAQVARSQIPDLPEGSSAGWSESESCPACGEAVDASAHECAGCGLVFATEE